MLNTTERRVVFVLFCLFTVGCAVFEGYLVRAVVENGFTGAKSLGVVLAGGVLVGCGSLFLRLVSKTFLRGSITSDRLHRSSSERFRIIEDARRSGQDEYQTRMQLVTNTLKFAEECLRGWVPGSHFEFCVFVDQQQPYLFAYFDSNHDVNARSMKDREQNPYWYVEKGYEVTKLLKAPTSHPRVLQDTSDAKLKYVFTSGQQRKQLRSSILLCLDVATPCALVISSNEKKAFPESDPEVLSFVKYIGSLVRYDLFEGDFIREVRACKPALFDETNASDLQAVRPSRQRSEVKAPEPKRRRT
jgi:hypothetical protein